MGGNTFDFSSTTITSQYTPPGISAIVKPDFGGSYIDRGSN